MRVFGVVLAALLTAGMQAQDPLVTLPNNYNVILDNAEVRVIRAHYGPHEKVPVHDHPGMATVFVYLNDSGKVRIDHDGVGAFSVVRPPTVTGSYRIAGAMAERHSIENLGDQPSEFLRVELKRVNLEMKEPFRGKAAVTSLKSEDTVEFSQSGVRVERVVCVGAAACSVKADGAASLLVAFGPVSLASGDEKTELEVGGVRWLPTAQGATVVSKGGSSVQLLRIVLPEGK